MRKVTIVHLITGLDIGGAERMLTNVVCGMDPQRFNNIVISLKGLGHFGPIMQQHGIQVYALQMRPRISSLSKLRQLWQILRRTKPDYVQGWMYHANLLALLIGKTAGVKNIYWNIRCSTMDLSQYSFTTRLVCKLSTWLSWMPQAILNNSQTSIKQHSAAGYNSKRWLYLPNGFDLQKFKPDAQLYTAFRITHNLPANSKLIGMFARWDPMKDHATFLHAAGKLASQRDDVYFVMAGKDVDLNNPAINKIIAQHNLQQRVILLGAINNVHEILPAMDYVTQTSVFGEGFPNVLGEAMACGVPCFCTDVGDSLEVIGDTGFKIPTQNAEALAQRWQQVLRNTNTQRNPAARARIENLFSLDSVVKKYSTIYEGSCSYIP